MSDLPRTLPHPPDAIESPAGSETRSRDAQLDLPSGPATAPLAPAGGDPYLGPPHQLSGQAPKGPDLGAPDRITPIGPPSLGQGEESQLARELRAQMVAARARRDRVPAQPMPDRFRVEEATKREAPARLRARRGLMSFSLEEGEDRQAKCWWVRRGHGDVTVTRRDTWRVVGERVPAGAYNAQNLVQCQRGNCPVCGIKIARTAAAALGVAFARHLGGSLVDAARDAAAAAALVDAMPDADLRRHDALVAADARWCDVWMLSLTVPHDVYTPTETTVDILYAASEKLFADRAWKAFAQRWGIVARVRVVDVTFGGRHGSHPHFHLALFATRAAMPENLDENIAARAAARARVRTLAHSPNVRDRNGLEIARERAQLADLEAALMRRVWVASHKQSLLSLAPMREAKQEARTGFLDELSASLTEAWGRAVRAAAGGRVEIDPRNRWFRENALKLTPAEHAIAYFTKWGLADEVGASTSKANNHLRLLDALCEGYDVAGDAYLDFSRAMKGRQWVSGIGKLCSTFGITEDDCAAYVAELSRKRRLYTEEVLKQSTVDVRALTFTIPPSTFPAVHVAEFQGAVGWDALFLFVDDLDGRGFADDEIADEVSRFLWRSSANRPPDS